MADNYYRDLADMYNASDEGERQAWAKNAAQRTKAFEEGKYGNAINKNVREMNAVIDKGLNIFSSEVSGLEQDIGLTQEQIKKDMLAVYAAETNFGTHPTMVSKTGVVGHFQVTGETFEGLKQGYIGPKFTKALGMTMDEFNQLNRNQLVQLMQDNKVASMLAGMGAYLQKKRHNYNVKQRQNQSNISAEQLRKAKK